MLAHIRNGKVVGRYSSERGRIILENGDTVSPVIEGYENGNDKVVRIDEVSVDNSTGPNTKEEQSERVEADRVVITRTKTDVEVTRRMVNDERDRRIASGFVFDGKSYDFDQLSKQRVAGAATLAGFAMGAGAGAGNLRWANPNNDFGFIAQDNSINPMDAPTAFAFGQAAANHETRHIFGCKAIKEMSPIPANFADDKYWP